MSGRVGVVLTDSLCLQQDKMSQINQRVSVSASSQWLSVNNGALLDVLASNVALNSKQAQISVPSLLRLGDAPSQPKQTTNGIKVRWSLTES